MTFARAILLFCGLLSVASGAEPPTVRELSEPSRWEFVGQETFSAAALRRSLACDLDVLAASRNTLPDFLLRALTQAVKSGYVNAGFPHVEVTASVIAERGRVVLTIDEGRRYRRGRVEIRGATTIPVDRLEAAIQRPPPKSEAAQPSSTTTPLPGWSEDHPPSFAPSVWWSWKVAIAHELKRHGYLDASVRVSIRPEADGTATLVVDILNEGSRAVLGEVQVRGTTNHSREGLMQFLGLEAGMLLDCDLQDAVKAKLRESGRFLQHDVEVLTPPFSNGPSQLLLTVYDIPGLPPLPEELPPLQQTALQVAHRFAAKWHDWERNASVTIDPAELPVWLSALRRVRTLQARVVTSVQHSGTLIECEARNDAADVIAREVLLIDRDRFIWLSPLRGAKYEVTGVNQRLVAQLEWLAKPPKQGEEPGKMLWFGFNLGYKNLGSNEPAPSQIEWTIAPAALLAASVKPDYKTAIEEGQLTFTGPDCHHAFDIDTGEMRRFEFVNVMRARCGDDLWTAAAARWRDAVQNARQEYNPEATVTSFFRFAAEEASQIVGPEYAVLTVIRRLLDAGVLRQLDQHGVFPAELGFRDHFTIPPAENAVAGAQLTVKPYLQMMLPIFEKCFPRETPAWILAREGVFLVAPTKGAAPASPVRMSLLLEDAGAGPLVYLMGAALYGRLSPAYRVALGESGLAHLTPAEFRRDCQALCRDDCLPGGMLRAYAETLRQAHPEDLGQLAAFFRGAREREAIRRALHELGRRRDEPLREVLPDLAEQMWEPVFKPLVESALQEFARPPQAP